MTTTTSDALKALTSPSSSTTSASKTKSVNTLSIDDFLTLMTTQLKNQDPLNPTDSNAMLTQLTQMSTVSGISSMNTTLTTLSDSLRSSQALSGASLVGHTILAPASSAAYTSGTSLSGAVDVPAGATSVTVTITDSTGAVVRHITGSPGTGLQSFSWDGTTDGGAQAASGTYSVSVAADVNGTSTAETTLLNGKVSSVTLDSTGNGVTVNTSEFGSVALSNVRQIS